MSRHYELFFNNSRAEEGEVNGEGNAVPILARDHILVKDSFLQTSNNLDVSLGFRVLKSTTVYLSTTDTKTEDRKSHSTPVIMREGGHRAEPL